MRLVTDGWLPWPRRRTQGFFVLMTAVLMASLLAGTAGSQDEETQDRSPRTVEEIRSQDLIETGREAYDIYCSGCHGLDGDGKGPAAHFLDPLPRDFSEAVFKFRSTPSGALPTDGDLHRTLSQGVLGTSMPSWYLIPENTKLAIIQYLKTFSDAWDDEYNYEAAVALPGAPDYIGDEDSIDRGGEIYVTMRCGECHGATGIGDGPAANTLTDDWGLPIKAFDFTSGNLKGGSRPEDVYRTFSTGLNGTPMPSYADILGDEERWHLVSFILSLRQSGQNQSQRR